MFVKIIIALENCETTPLHEYYFFFCNWFWHFRDFFESTFDIFVILVTLMVRKIGKMKRYYTMKVIIYFIFCKLDTWVKFMVEGFRIQVHIQPGQDVTFIQKVLCRKGLGGLLLIYTRVSLVRCLPLTFRDLYMYILHTIEIFW